MAVTDSTRPAILTMLVYPDKFRAARRGGTIAVYVGATVRYRLSESASTRFTVERRLIGRKVGRRCLPYRRSLRRKAPCTRYVGRGSFGHSGRAGLNSFGFTGRMRVRRLAPGRYRLVARATDPAGNRSPVERVAFRIVR